MFLVTLLGLDSLLIRKSLEQPIDYFPQHCIQQMFRRSIISYISFILIGIRYCRTDIHTCFGSFDLPNVKQ